MGELSIKIRIGDREYPMRIDSGEEEKIRIAGKLINEKLRQFKDQFGIDDKQDLLAMTTFDAVVTLLKGNESTETYHQTIQQRLASIDQILSTALSE
ncbi:MAG: cell division protein ZapA [Cytophagaceae bacterium]|jgi:cell division protein ZapA|nr:cell division protein ZapA [Cytophagaceae bacterium]